MNCRSPRNRRWPRLQSHTVAGSCQSEPLEPRRMLAVFTGTDGADLIRVTRVGSFVHVNINGNDFSTTDSAITINARLGNDDVRMDYVHPAIVVNLDAGDDTVRYGGNTLDIFGDLPQTLLVGDAGTDTVVFDDTNGPLDTPRAYLFDDTSAMNQVLFDFENLTIRPRDGAFNSIAFAGGFPVSQRVLVEGPIARDPNVALGVQGQRIDLDAFDVHVDITTNADLHVFDQDFDASAQPWELYLAPGNVQRIDKGGFSAALTRDDSDVVINGGTTADRFAVSGLLPDGRVTLNGGAGDDSLFTANRNGQDNDLDAVFAGEISNANGRTEFVGGPGIDSLDLDDSGDETNDNDNTYHVQPESLHKQPENPFRGLIRFDTTTERINVAADAGNTTFRFRTGDGQEVTLGGGLGNDTFDLGVNVVLAANRGTTTVVGGPGADVLPIGDATDDLREYTFSAGAMSYADAAGTRGTIAYDATLEDFDFSQSHASTTTHLNGKLPGVRLNINAGDGDDAFVAGGGDLDDRGFFPATTTVLGGVGFDTITFDDRLDDESESETYAFAATTLTKGSAGLTYAGFDAQTLLAADAGAQVITPNTVNINATNGAMTSTTITGGSLRPNDVNVTQGNLASLTGLLTINLGATGGTVNVNDQNDTGNDNYIIEAAQLRKSVLGQTQATINFTGLDALVLNANASANNIIVNHTAAGTLYTVNAGGGDDMVTIGGGNVAVNLLGVVHVNGGADSASVAIDNRLDAAPSQQRLFALTFTDVLSHTFGSIDALSIENGTGGGNLNLDRVTVFTFADSPSANQSVFIGLADLDFHLQADCSIGRATRVVINDLLDTGNDGYVVENHLIRKTTPGAHSISVAHSNGGVVELHANHGNNTINVRVDQPGTNLRLFGNGGNDQFVVTDTVVLSTPQTVDIDTGPEQPSTVEPLGDYVTVNSDAGTVGDVGAKVRLLASDVIRRLTVNAAGTFEVPTGVTVQPVEMNLPGGTIDLAGGALLSRAGGPSLATFRTLLTRGRNNGAWNGTNAAGAIHSSLAAGSTSGDGVGYGLGSEVAPTSIGPFTIAPGDTLVRHTLDGDADLDRRVNLADFNRLAGNFGSTAVGWAQGDFNYDPAVTLADFNLLAVNFGRSAAPGDEFAELD